ncbi:MAG: spermidine synthase [Gammaproteobacteria bacterium RBG_16_57_12]|nr:MAG: spermidine synthase [Gammaproteobacteria bacterium RBG_16_57_12]
MSLGKGWFTEVYEQGGSAFSLKIKGKVHEYQSRFQKIEVYETETYGYLMVIDGCTMVSTRENFFYHEMIAHPVLFTHPRPRRVLIIGGGDCGTLREVLKHPGVELAQQVDIDEGVTRAAEQYFPELCASNNDPRAELYFEDGIKWAAEADAGFYDIIIVDGTDPVGPGEGLFNEAFYRSCVRALGKDGLLVQQTESPLYHMKLLNDVRLAMKSAGFTGVHTLTFPQPIYPSGWWTATIATRSGAITGGREQDILKKPFETVYYNLDMHRAALAQPEFMKRELKG